MTTEAQQAALEQAVVRVVYFCEFQFASATSRVSTLNQALTWGGYEWAGLGAIGGISAVQEGDTIESAAVNFSLNAVVPEMVAMAAGSVEEYRGRPAKMWMCPLTENFQLIDDPVLCWRGIMDMISIGIEGEESKIILKCETSAYGLKRRSSFRLNAAQHKKKYPQDTGFDYLNDLIAKPSLWLSKRFQSV